MSLKSPLNREKILKFRGCLILMAVVTMTSFAQKSKLDQLKEDLNAALNDSSEVATLLKISGYYTVQKQYEAAMEFWAIAMANPRFGEVEDSIEYKNIWKEIGDNHPDIVDKLLEQVSADYQRTNLYTYATWRFSPNNMEYANKWTEKALLVARSKYEEADAHQWIAHIAVQQDNIVAGIDHYKESIGLFKEIKDTVNIIKRTIRLGKCYFSLSNIKDAIKCIEEAEYLLQAIENLKRYDDSLYRNLRYRLLLFAGKLKTAQGEYYTSIEALEEVIQLNGRKSRYLFSLANNYHLIGNYEESSELLKEGIAKHKARNFEALNQLYFYLIGMNYRKIGSYDSAIYYFNRALDIAITYNAHPRAVETYSTMAMLEFEMGHQERAMEYVKKVENYYEQNTENTAEKYRLEWESTVHEQLEQLDSAIFFRKLQINLLREDGLKQSLPHALLAYGELLKKAGNWQQAIHPLKEAKNLSERQGNTSITFQALYNLAVVEEKLNNDMSALRYANQSLALAQSLQNPMFLIDSYQILAKIYEKEKDYETAHKYQQLFTAGYDTLASFDKKQRMAEQAVIFQVKGEQLEANLLVAERERAAAIANKRLLIIVSLVLLISLLLLIIVLYANRIKLKAKAQLQQRITRDVHDDMGGILNDLKRDAKEAIERPTDKQFVQERLQHIILLSRKAMHSLKTLILNIEERPKTLQAIKKEVQQIAEERLKRYNTPFSLDINGFEDEQSLPFEVHFNLMMIYKEAIENAVKHGANEPINIRLNYSKNTVSLEVENTIKRMSDGTYFLQRGLNNMRERARKAKGLFNYQQIDDLFVVYFNVLVV